MNQIKNTVQLIGHLGKDVKVTSFDSGSRKAEFSLATTSAYKNSKGELVKDTQWHTVVGWGPQADKMEKLLRKGSYIALQGSLAYRSYQDKNGSDKVIAEILTDSFISLEKTTKPE
jgi:single-strand DNA-binding protein